MRKDKTLYCDFYPYCALGAKCSKRLTVEIFNDALMNRNPIDRSNCFTQHPACFIEKIKNKG